MYKNRIVTELSRVAASLGAMITVSQADAQSINSRFPYDPDGHHCAFRIPDEISRDEAWDRFNRGEDVDPRLSAYVNLISNERVHTDLWFQMKPVNPALNITQDQIQIYADISELVGQERTIDRIERDDETLTIADSLLSGSIITLTPGTGTINIVLEDGRDETKTFNPVKDVDGNIFYEAIFPSLGMRASYEAPEGTQDKQAPHYFKVGEYNFETNRYSLSYYGLTAVDGILSASFTAGVDYENPIDTGPAALTCRAQELEMPFGGLAPGFN